MSIYVFSSSDSFLLEEEKNSIIKKYNIDPFNITTYDFVSSNPLEILSEITTVSLLGDMRMVIVNNPEILKSTYKNTEIINKFISYFKTPNVETLLVFLCDFTLAENLEINQVLFANSQYKKINAITGDNLTNWVINYAVAKGYKIDELAANELIERTSAEISMIRNELEKLMLYCDDKNITIKSIRLLVNKNLDDNIFSFLNAFLAHDSKKLLAIYDDFVTLNEDEMRIISSINNKVEEIMYTKVLLNQGLKKDQIADYFKVKPGRAYYMIEAAKKMSDKALNDIINRLSDLDYKIKTGVIEKRLGFQLFILGA